MQRVSSPRLKPSPPRVKPNFIVLRARPGSSASGGGTALWGELSSAMVPPPSPTKARRVARAIEITLDSAKSEAKRCVARPGAIVAAIVSALIFVFVLNSVVRRGRRAGGLPSHRRAAMPHLPSLGRLRGSLSLGGELESVFGPDADRPLAQLEWQLHRYGTAALAEASLPPQLAERWHPTGRGIIIACCDGVVDEREDWSPRSSESWRKSQRALLFALVQLIRDDHDCELPIEVWHRGLDGDDEMRQHDELRAKLMRFSAVRFFDASRTVNPLDGRPLSTLSPQSNLLAFALLASKLNEVLLFEGVDSFPLLNPNTLFDGSLRYAHRGALAWWVPANFKASPPPEDAVATATARAKAFEQSGSVAQAAATRALAVMDAAAARAKKLLANSTAAWSGQLLVDKRRTWKALATAWLYATVAMRSPQRAARYGSGLGLVRIGFATHDGALESAALVASPPIVLGFDKGTGTTRAAFVATAFAHVSPLLLRVEEDERGERETAPAGAAATAALLDLHEWTGRGACPIALAHELAEGMAFVASASPKKRRLLLPKPVEGQGFGAEADGSAFPRLIEAQTRAELPAAMRKHKHPWQDEIWSLAVVPTNRGDEDPRLHLHLHKKLGRANIDKRGFGICRLDQTHVGNDKLSEAPLSRTLQHIHASVHTAGYLVQGTEER